MNLPRQTHVNVGRRGIFPALIILGVGGLTGAASPAEPLLTTRHGGTAGSPALWGIGLFDSLGGGGANYFAVGEQGRILRSTDSATWTVTPSGTTEWLTAVECYSLTVVTVGDHGTILVSRDRGLTWAPAASGTTARLNGIIHVVYSDNASSRWIAVGESGTILVSPDAERWLAVDSGTTAWLRGVTWFYRDGSPRVVAVGRGGTAVMSQDAPEWHRWQRLSTGTARDLEAANGDVFAGEAGAIVVGADANTGTARLPAPETADRLRGVCSTGAGRIAVGENGAIVLGAVDPLQWSRLNERAPVTLNAAVFTPRGVLAVGSNETILQIVPPYPARLLNLSTRAFIHGGDEVLITGFSVDDPNPKRLLIRAAGPVLAQFGVTSPLPKPILKLFDSAGRQLAMNAGWDTGADTNALRASAAQIGAFPFSAGGEDSALLVTLPAGNYTAHVASAERASGIALVELYDLDPISGERGRLKNISARGFVGSGQQLVIPGVILRGEGLRTLLIRAVGPSLSMFGVAFPLPDPQINVRGLFTDDWNKQQYTYSTNEVREMSRLAGAFPLPEGSKDAATLYRTGAGKVDIMVTDTRDATGEVLVEVYDVTGL